MPKETLAEGIEIYCGDCRDILPSMGRVDAVLTDPPYGIGESAAKNLTRSKGAAKPRDYGTDDWDPEPAPKEVIAWIRDNSRWQIIFGGNYFELPPTTCWLVWDKENGASDFADCELAWTNLPKAVRRIDWMWNGMLRKGNEPREHLTQKPLGVIRWCIDHLPTETKLILDPFMGSGTTGVACVNLGRKFIGIEREPKYYDIARRRISEALRQPNLFIEKPKPIVQESLL